MTSPQAWKCHDAPLAGAGSVLRTLCTSSATQASANSNCSRVRTIATRWSRMCSNVAAMSISLAPETHVTSSHVDHVTGVMRWSVHSTYPCSVGWGPCRWGSTFLCDPFRHWNKATPFNDVTIQYLHLSENKLLPAMYDDRTRSALERFVHLSRKKKYKAFLVHYNNVILTFHESERFNKLSISPWNRWCTIIIDNH